MSNKIYLLSYERKLGYDYTHLLEGIKACSSIKDWWHYISSAYILVSPLTSNALANEILKFFPDNRFLLVELDLTNYQGWLPPDAWKWIRKYK